MDYVEFDKLSDRLTDCYYKLDEEAHFMTDEPATEEEICAVEERLGVRIPDSLRQFFLCYTREYRISAFLPEEFCEDLPDGLESLFAARFTIALRDQYLFA